MRTATVGQLMIDQALPPEMRGKQRTLDKKGVNEMLRELAESHPESYRRVTHQLNQIALRVAYSTGGNSFGLRHMLRPKGAMAKKIEMKKKINAILSNDTLDDDKRDQLILRLMGDNAATQQKAIFEETKAAGNPLTNQVISGARGNPGNLVSLLGGDGLYADHRGQALPVPVVSSYSEGLSPVEYWAGAYGARKGVIDLKFATQDAGFLSKQFNQLAHRLVVSALDGEDATGAIRGLPVDLDDDESEGGLLAADVGGYKRNTIITPKVLSSLRRKGIKRMLVRSPAVGGPADGGVYARDVGVREKGHLAMLGENAGMTAAQALSNPLTQAQISSKHSGGVVGESAQAISGFDWINQMVQTPKHFKGGAAHAEVDGLVQRVEDAPAGGKYVWIENKRHYIGKGFDPRVKKGQHVDAGDVISDGAPNPSTIVKHKGIGEGRRYFIQAFRQAFRDAGIKGHRRNVELMARGLINHVRLTQEMGDYVPDDIVPYQALEASYKPRPGGVRGAPQQMLGKYLERPYLHHSIGTKIRPSMLPDFQQFGITEVDAHDDEPPFEPEMIRGMSSLQHDPDWLTRLFGTGQKKSLLTGIHRGATSDATGTSFVPGLARGVDFGRIGKVHAPTPHAGQMSGPLKTAWPWSQPEPQPVNSLSPEAAHQLMLGNFHAGRREQALQAVKKNNPMETTMPGRALGFLADKVESRMTWFPGIGWLSLAGFKDPRAGVAPDELGPLDFDAYQGSVLNPRAVAEHAVAPWMDDMVSQLTPQNQAYAYNAVQGNQYLLPGQGKWIDQYNAAIRTGTQPPPHVVSNATYELQAAHQEGGSEGSWIDQVRTPELNKMINDQQVFDAQAEHRAESARVTANHINAAIEKKYPGYTMAQHGEIPPAGYQGPGMQVAIALDAAGQAWAAKPDRSKDEYQAYVNKVLADNGVPINELPIHQESLQNSLAAADQQLSGNLQTLHRDYQWEVASPEERLALEQQWQQAETPLVALEGQQPPQPTQSPVQPEPQQLSQERPLATPPPVQAPQLAQAPAATGQSGNPYENMAVPWQMQAAGMAPGMVNKAIQTLGPAGIGAYGLLINPGDVMTLARGPSRNGTPRPQNWTPKPTALPRPQAPPTQQPQPMPRPQSTPQPQPQPRPQPQRQPTPQPTPQPAVKAPEVYGPPHSGIMSPPQKTPKIKPPKAGFKPPVSMVPG